MPFFGFVILKFIRKPVLMPASFMHIGSCDNYSMNRLSNMHLSTLWFWPGRNATGIVRSIT